jgi:hypothetical protein
VSNAAAALNARRKFSSASAYSYVRTSLDQARAALSSGNLTTLTTLCQNLKNNKLNGNPILDPLSAEELEIQANRLLKRARFVAAGLIPITGI